MTQTDLELLGQYARDGSARAFDELVKRHAPWVYRASLRQVGGDVHLAEDVTQAVFILLARRAGELPQGIRLGGWLFNTVRFAASEARRKEARRKRHEARAAVTQDAIMPATASASAQPDPHWQSLAPHLDDAVASLRESDRQVILLRFYEGREFGDMARVIGANEAAARKRLSRAVGRLRKVLVRQGKVAPAVTAAALVAMITRSTQAAPVPHGLAQSLVAAGAATAKTTAATGGSSAPLAIASQTTSRLNGVHKALASAILSGAGVLLLMLPIAAIIVISLRAEGPGEVALPLPTVPDVSLPLTSTQAVPDRTPPAALNKGRLVVQWDNPTPPSRPPTREQPGVDPMIVWRAMLEPLAGAWGNAQPWNQANPPKSGEAGDPAKQGDGAATPDQKWAKDDPFGTHGEFGGGGGGGGATAAFAAATAATPPAPAATRDGAAGAAGANTTPPSARDSAPAAVLADSSAAPRDDAVAASASNASEQASPSPAVVTGSTHRDNSRSPYLPNPVVPDSTPRVAGLVYDPHHSFTIQIYASADTAPVLIDLSKAPGEVRYRFASTDEPTSFASLAPVRVTGKSAKKSNRRTGRRGATDDESDDTNQAVGRTVPTPDEHTGTEQDETETGRIVSGWFVLTGGTPPSTYLDAHTGTSPDTPSANRLVASPVPEPGALTLLIVLAIPLAARRRPHRPIRSSLAALS